MRVGILRCAGLFSAAALAAVVPAGGLARAQPDTACRVVELEMTPTADLQIVAWIEDAGGNYVDTAFITRTTGPGSWISTADRGGRPRPERW